MQAAARPYVLASAALLATSMVAATPLVARQLQLPIRSIETRLADAGSVLNVPFNLFQDIVNVPYNEVEAIQQFGNSLLFSSTWLTASATNLWGEDPGDPGHFMSLVDMLVPFPQISGFGQPEIDPTADAAGTAGLGQQISLMLDAEVPVSASSAADWSTPLVPPTPITGLSGLDRAIWWNAELLGIQKYPLFTNWFQVPMSDLQNGYQFPTVVDPSAGVGPNGSVPGDYGFLGTHPEMGNIGYGVNDVGQTLNANGNPVNLMPWSNLEFKYDPAYPFQNFWDSLQQTPNLNGFEFPSLEEIGRALQSLAAGSVVAFDPVVPGDTTLCSADACGLNGLLGVESTVKAISDLWPGNTSIDNWLSLVNTPSDGPFGLPNLFGSANGPTQADLNYVYLYGTGQQQWWDFGNPSPADPPGNVYTPISFPISQPMQNLIDFMQASGIQNFFHEVANYFGYTPVDYPALGTDPAYPATAAADIASAMATGGTTPDSVTQLLADVGLGNSVAAGSSDWIAPLLGDFGLGDSLAAGSSDWIAPVLGDLGLSGLLSLF